MQRIVVLSFAVAAVVFGPSSRAQTGGMAGMEMKDKDRQGMDMSKCQDMMDKGRMGMKGMEMPKECKEMMDKQAKGNEAKPKATAKSGEKKSQSKSHKGSGTVTKVDPAGGKVTISHGPVQTLKWPAMSMTFGVSDKALLDHVHQGGKVEFEFVQRGKDYVITKIH
jgi:Cu(I)/Ag(I) efflux system protein CusF